jgi:integrase
MKKHKVTIQPCTIRGRKSWLVRWHEQGKVRRQYFKAKDGADAQAALLRGEQLGVNQFWAALTQAERETLFLVWREAERRRLDLMAMVTRTDVAPASKSQACSLVRTELLDAKTKAGLSNDYVGSLGQIVKAFIKGREALAMSLVKFEDVEKFVDSFNIKSRSTVRSRLATWFKFGVRRGYCLQNLCERLESVKVVKAPPRIFTLDEVKACLNWLGEHPRAFAWFVLSTFAGLRPEEAMKTTWPMIHFKEGWIRVEAQTSKISQRRVVYPLPAALTLLRKAKRLKSELPLTTKQLQNERNGLRAALEWPEWHQDVTRHTGCSMWLAQIGDAEKVALQLGHSEKVLHRNYKALVTRKDAEAFWAIA